MTGEELKKRIYLAKVSQAELASKLGMSQQLFYQTLKAADVKTGFLEKICEVLGVEMTFFYPPKDADVTIINTNTKGNGNAIATNGSTATATTNGASDEALMMLLKQNQQILDMLSNK